MSREARSRLAIRKKPYYRSIDQGRHIGFYKGVRGGAWTARVFIGKGRYVEKKLGATDDILDADGVAVLTFSQAQRAAALWFTEVTRRDSDGTDVVPYSVSEALTDYMKAYRRRGGRAADRMDYAINGHILPTFGDMQVSALTQRRLENWRNALTDAAPRLRVKKGEPARHRKNGTDPDAPRKRRATVNKIWAIFKAALNHAHAQRRVQDASAWQGIKPYRDVDKARVRWLTDNETVRLVNACPRDYRAIVTAALLTGARYGELAATKAQDFIADASTLHVPVTKSGKARHVHLTAEGVEFFRTQTAGLSTDDLIFRRADGGQWKQANQQRPLREACARAKISPPISFHILRHSYGSRLAMKGVPMPVIAAQLGHSDTRITSKHYAHLAPSYIGDAVREGFSALGILETTNLVPIGRKG